MVTSLHCRLNTCTSFEQDVLIPADTDEIDAFQMDAVWLKYTEPFIGIQ